MTGSLREMHLPHFPRLTREQTQILSEQAASGDEAAREQMIQSNLRLVFHLVQRFANRGYEMEDLFQIGTIGLMKAVDRFDHSYGVQFSTYAVPMILGEIRRFLRDDGPMRVSRSLKERSARIYQTQEALTVRLGREPRLSELAQALAMTPEQLTEAIEATRAVTSIYEETAKEEGDGLSVLDQLASQDGDGPMLEKLALGQAIQQLPERERWILYLRFYRDKTQMEVASQLGISQVQVSRLERGALQKVRTLLSS